MKEHPLNRFNHCPACGSTRFSVYDEKSKKCADCRFIYYFNPSAAVACFIRNHSGEYLFVRRAKEPAKGTLDLPGGFVDLHESAEEAVRREVREETNLQIADLRYLFSLPNIYPYAGFRVHTVDLFFECLIPDFNEAIAADDADSIVIRKPERICPEDFGLTSIRQTVKRQMIRDGNE
jgi:ADP-ribose pyrophosphatase YjhB (NUDIX family)